MNIKEHCLDKGFYFDDDTLYNFHTCLQTKPFTILYGPSGTGKSKIAELYADYICSQQGIDLKNHLCFIPVRPNWTSPSDLMGFYDYLNDTFIPSKFYKFLVNAEENPDYPYFLILDEMNLSIVEHYFSDFLSCLESRRLEKVINQNFIGWEDSVASQVHTTLSQAAILAFLDLVKQEQIQIDQSFEFKHLRDHSIVQTWKGKNFGGKESSWMPQFRTEFNQKGNGESRRLAGKFFESVSSGVYKLRQEQAYSLTELSGDIAQELVKQQHIIQHELEVYKNNSGIFSKEIPLNLYIIGTINMDESTHPLSSKVLDRANTIEMNNVSNNILQIQQAQSGALKINHLNAGFSQIQSLPTLNSLKELNASNSNIVDLIYSINDDLCQYRTNMGHRSIFEMAYYINNYLEGLDLTELNITNDDAVKEALDLQLSQKLVPKLMGADERVEKSIQLTIEKLTENAVNSTDQILQADMGQYDYPKTLDKLQRMYRYYNANGFVNFANV
jgi:energy-coupling factor transporter ATP-binding protein EcfA2